MNLSFSSKNTDFSSFSALCNVAYDYGYGGIEIYNPQSELKAHGDSVFNPNKSDSRRKLLMSKGIKISAVTYPQKLDTDSADEKELLRYIDFARYSGTDYIIVSLSEKLYEGYENTVARKLRLPLAAAARYNITLLFETSGELADSYKMISLINSLASISVGVCWCIRNTFFDSGEDPEKTITNLGAYINFVRLGDRKNGKDCLIGEGDLPVKDFIFALSSLDYNGFVSVEWNEEITDCDIVLTHFQSFLSDFEKDRNVTNTHYLNRSGTGSFPYKKYDILEKTFSEVLDTLADEYPDQPCFIYSDTGKKQTYSRFRREVDKVCAAFIALGIKKGHHIAVWATNLPEWYLTFWAAVKIGAVLVTVNTAYREKEMEYLLRQSDTHTLIMIESHKGISYKEIIKNLCPELETTEKGTPLYAKSLPFLRNVVTVGFETEGALTWDEMTEKGIGVPIEEVKRRAAAVRPDDVANIQYTSGTTGFPKGVMLTHRNIINNGKTIGDRMDLSSADRMMIQVPMFHCFGMVLSMTSTMTHAGTVCPLPYFSPKSSLACINREKITCFNGVPTMFVAMFSHEDFKKTDFSYMRCGIMAGANCPPELMKRAADEMNMKEIISVYGQTEASPGCTMGEVNESLELRTETVGSAFPNIECKIIDPQTGEDLPDGENGEFVARGFNIMKGYYKMPKATEKTVDREGWLHSGDICMKTPEGYYKVTGRLKDMIIRGGENISPREIEEAYLKNPGVKDCTVVGVPDKAYGEEVCAFIILNEGETEDTQEMIKFGLSVLAKYKLPKYFIFTDKFEMNAAGKILKYKMRENAEKILFDK